MNRKRFMEASAILFGGVTIPFKNALADVVDEDTLPCKIPPSLKPGDLIGITSPAGPSKIEEIQPAIAALKSWGYEIRLGTSIGKKDFTRGGTDEERLTDLQQMLDDPQIKAIMCSRGGYGAIRIVDQLDWTKFKARPKWLIGFSDITVLHSHIHNQCRVATIHSKMTNSFPDDLSTSEPLMIDTIGSIHLAISGKTINYPVLPNPQNKLGKAEGLLVGGNLKTLESLAGSASDIKTDNKILFVEDTGEYLYSIDRMFWNLKRTGKLKKLKGLVVGGFKIKADDPGDEFGKTLQEIVLEKIKDYHYPVCFDFPVGHQRANFALKCGKLHRFSVTEQEVILKEIV